MSAQPAYSSPDESRGNFEPRNLMNVVYSEAEYLAFDEQAEGRWEFLDGRIVPVGAPEMANQLDPTFRAGASFNHNELSRVLGGIFFNRLHKGCRAYTAEMRTYTPVSKTYSYPDLVAFCGSPAFHNPEAKTPSLTNAVLIVEVLSESTGEYDRSGKFMRYRSIASLKQYLLVDSRRMLVDLYTRLPDHTWQYWPGTLPEHVIDLHSVGCQLTLAELYAEAILPSLLPPVE